MVGKAGKIETKYFVGREEWRAWLIANFDQQDDIWLAYPRKSTGKRRILYNDAVEEALCFGWIDSTVRSLDPDTTIQRFCKRRAKSSFSQANKERLKWLMKEGLVHPSIQEEVANIVREPFIFPDDIMHRLQADETVWQHYQQLSASYRRIRIAYIDSARRRPEEFTKRLNHFISKTKANELIKGFSGIDKYY